MASMLLCTLDLLLANNTCVGVQDAAATLDSMNKDTLTNILHQVASSGDYGLHSFSLGCRQFNEACKEFSQEWVKAEEARLTEMVRDGLMTMVRNRKAIADHKNALSTRYAEGQQIPMLEWHEEFILKPIKLGHKEHCHRQQLQSTLKEETTKLRAAITGVKRKNREEATALVRQALEEEKAKFKKRVRTSQIVK